MLDKSGELQQLQGDEMVQICSEEVTDPVEVAAEVRIGVDGTQALVVIVEPPASGSFGGLVPAPLSLFRTARKWGRTGEFLF